jgi:hypothetical protein
MPTDGRNIVASDFCSYQLMNVIKNCFYGASAPASPVAGLIWVNSATGAVTVYDASTSTWIGIGRKGAAPVGSIVAYSPGYFTDGSNGGYTRVLGSANTVAAVNTLLNASFWYVCDGAALSLSGSPIWSAASRYLPNLTDDRFIQGDTAAGSIGGGNVNDHLHSCDPPSYDVPVSGGVIKSLTSTIIIVSPYNHVHTIDIAAFDSGVPTVTENRPVYLACFYIIRVK